MGVKYARCQVANNSDSEPQVGVKMAEKESGISLCLAPATVAMCKGRSAVVRAEKSIFEVNYSMT